MDKHRADNAEEQFLKNELRKIARNLTGVEKRISIVERSAQGKFRSVTGGSTVYYDEEGVVRQVVGQQADGSYTTADVNAPPLLAPSDPIIEAREGTLTITWDGRTKNGSNLWPKDFNHVEVHISTEEDFPTSNGTEIASFHALAGGSTTQALAPDVEYYIKLIAVNTSGVESPASDEISAIVLPFSTGFEIYYENEMPMGLGLGDEGALWIDTNDDNRQYYWDGTQWIDIQPSSIDTAIDTAIDALNVANGKAKIFAQDGIPTSTAAGDLWVDTNDSNKMYRAFAAGVSTIGASAWVLFNDPTAKTTTFAQTGIPTATAVGDIWVDTDDNNKLYRAYSIGADAITAGEWVDISSSVPGTNKIFAQNGIPVSVATGDLWIDTDDSNKMYVAKSVGADAVTTGEWELFNDLTTKTKTFAQTSIPTSVTAGDLWVDTDDNNKLYRAFAAGVNTIGSSGWVLISDPVGQVLALQTLWGHPADITLIDGGDIYTNSVKAQSIILADFLNYARNPAFDVGTVGAVAPEWVNAVKKLSSSSGVPAGAPYATVGHQTVGANWNVTYFEVTPGESFQVEWTAATPDSAKNFAVGLHFVAADKTTTIASTTVLPQQTPTSAWTEKKGVVVVPSNAKWARAYTEINGTAPFGNWYFTGLKIRRRAGGELIVDGSINSVHVVTDGLDAGIIKFGTMSGTRIQSKTVDTDKLTADAIDGMIITGALFRTASSGARMEIDSNGILQYNAAEGLLTRIGSGQNKFSGSVDADDMLVRNGLQLFGQDNAFMSNSKVILRSGQAGSTQAPILTNTYEQQAIAGDLTIGFRPLFGYHTDGTNQYGITNFFAAGEFLAKDPTTKRYYAWDQMKITQSDGSIANRVNPGLYTRIQNGAGQSRAVTIGEYKTAGWNPAEYPSIGLHVWDDTVMTSAGTVAPVDKPSVNRSLSAWSWNKSYALGRFIDSTNATAKTCYVYGILNKDVTDTLDLKVVAVASDTSSSDFASVTGINFATLRADPDERLTGITYGKAGQMLMYVVDVPNPEQTVWIIHTSHQNIVLNSAGTTRLTDIEWPVQSGATHRVTAHGSISSNTFTYFAHLSFTNNYNQPVQNLSKYSNWSWKGTASSQYVCYSWRGHSSKVAPEWLTLPSPVAQRIPTKRGRFTISVPPLPPPEGGTGTTRDTNKDVFGWVPYIGGAAANTSLHRQTALTPTGDPTTVTSIDMTAGFVVSNVNPVTVNTGFPTGSPAKVESSGNTSGTPYISFDADGAFQSKTINASTTLTYKGNAVRPAGEITMYGGSTAPGGSLLCNGQSVTTAAYPALFSAIGYTYGGSGANFLVPNLTGRFALGSGNSSTTGSVSHALGNQGGEEKHALTIAELAAHDHGALVSAGGFHNHTGATQQAGYHNHGFDSGGFPVTSGGGTPAGIDATGGGYVLTNMSGAGDHTHVISSEANHQHGISSQGSGTAHNTMPPYTTVNYIIWTG